MTRTQTERLLMFGRVAAFGKEHQDLFPPDGLAGQAFAEVDAAFGTLQAQARTQVTVKRKGRHFRTDARRTVVDYVETVSRVARVVAQKVTGFDEPFQLPAQRSDQAYLTAGRAFAEQLKASRAQFAAAGLPAALLDGFDKAVDDFDQALGWRQAGEREQTAARAATASAMDAAWAAVRNLDVLVPVAIRDQPVTMALWEAARRVDYFYAKKRSKDEASDAPAVDAAAPAAVQDDVKAAS